jgi:hypothetical protein
MRDAPNVELRRQTARSSAMGKKDFHLSGSVA